MVNVRQYDLEISAGQILGQSADCMPIMIIYDRLHIGTGGTKVAIVDLANQVQILDETVYISLHNKQKLVCDNFSTKNKIATTF